MRLHPQHRIDPVFAEYRVPGALVDLPFGQSEVVAQQSIRIGGGGPAVDEHGYGASGVEDQKSADVPVVQKPGMREMRLKIAGILL
jgi:hypothetical protein